MEMDFDVKVAAVGSDAFVVSLAGEADLHNAPEIERVLKELVARDARYGIVDLVDVGFVDSTVLGLLLRFQPRFRMRGGDIVLVSDDRRLLRTLEITGLDRIFRIEQRLGDAVSGAYVQRSGATA
ncbi:MAG TPA: anti-sigma factor antagonist [Gaiellaceae bacterium]|jgi:anti-anti-sigma factor